MARKNHLRRTLREIYTLADEIGADRVLLHDGELGAVLAGSDKAPLKPGTIANRRYFGKLNLPVVKTDRTPRTRLSDALALIERKTTQAAA